jgi:hypothetical protein
MLARAWSDCRVLELQSKLRLCLPHVIGHLEAFMKSAFDNLPPTGRINKQQMNHLETWAMWCGKRGLLRKAMLETGLIAKRRRCFFVADFSTSVPEYVRKRWNRQDLQSQASMGFVRTSPDISAPQDKPRTGKRGKVEKSLAVPSQVVQGAARQDGDAQRQEEKTNGAPASDVVPPRMAAPAGAPSVESLHGKKEAVEKQDSSISTFAVCSEPAARLVKAVSGQKDAKRQLPGGQRPEPTAYADCTDYAQRLKLALTQNPPEPPFMILVAAGMEPNVARQLSHAHTPERIRQVAVYAARHADRNPAGLIRKCLENPKWGRP